MTTNEAWAALTAPIPESVLKPLAAAEQRGLTGMSDIPEWYLSDRLHASGLPWSLEVLKTEMIAHVKVFKGRDEKRHEVDQFVVGCHARLHIDGRYFDGVGSHQDEDYDWAAKGAETSAFKTCCKWAGISMSVWKNGAKTPTASQPTAPQVHVKAVDCPSCGEPLKYVPGGISKATGKAYDAFAACSAKCGWKPTRENPTMGMVA